MRALIVDDSRAYRMLLQRSLKHLGFDTVEAENGTEALELLRKEKDIQLITVDQNMPIMPGTQLVQLVRELAEFKTVPILMISVDEHGHKEALDAGVTEYLIKPVTTEMIGEKLIWMGITPPGRGAERDGN